MGWSLVCNETLLMVFLDSLPLPGISQSSNANDEKERCAGDVSVKSMTDWLASD